MRIIYQVTHAVLQGALTSTMIYLWGFLQTWNIEQAALSTGALVLFLGIYNVIINIAFIGKSLGMVKPVITSIVSSLLTTLTFWIYPDLGLVIEWYLLLGVLLFAAVIAHVLLYGVGRSSQGSHLDD